MQAKITFVLAMWQGWRPMYEAKHALALAKMLREHLSIPHKVVLLSDSFTELEGIEVYPVPEDPEGLKRQTGPNCYRRLKYFDPEFAGQFGTQWIASIDLDTLIVGDITPVVQKALSSESGFCILAGRDHNQIGKRPYNGALWFLRAGEHSHVWEDFDGKTSPHEVAKTGWVGSDQAWISMKIPGHPTLSAEDGVYFLGEYKRRTESDPKPRMINFAGVTKPWTKTAQMDIPEIWQAYQAYL